MEDAWDYEVNVEIVFDVAELYGGDFNHIGVDQYIEKELTDWIYNSFNIADYIREDVLIDFRYCGKEVTASFAFEICDDSQEEAESYADSCIDTESLPEGIVYRVHRREAIEIGSDKH